MLLNFFTDLVLTIPVILFCCWLVDFVGYGVWLLFTDYPLND